MICGTPTRYPVKVSGDLKKVTASTALYLSQNQNGCNMKGPLSQDMRDWWCKNSIKVNFRKKFEDRMLKLVMSYTTCES
jgi:hypothetical protein